MSERSREAGDSPREAVDAARRAMSRNCPHVSPTGPEYASKVAALVAFCVELGIERFELYYNLREPGDRVETWERMFHHGQISKEELAERLRGDADRPIDERMLREFCELQEGMLKEYAAVLECALEARRGTFDPDRSVERERTIDEHVKAMRGRLPMWSQNLRTVLEFVDEVRAEQRLGVAHLGEFSGASAHWLAWIVVGMTADVWSTCKAVADRSQRDPRYLYPATAERLFVESWLPRVPPAQALSEELRHEYTNARIVLRRRLAERDRGEAAEERKSMRAGKLVRLEDVEEFAVLLQVPEGSIVPEVLRGVANLDERKHLEPFLRDLLHDPNVTPHGPTEIADILTTRVTIRGEPRFAAFVLKGKATRKVIGEDVSHQFFKLQTLKRLDLVGLIAVGSIQDDAQRNFMTTAEQIGCDYLIADNLAVARLLLAAGRICPEDGLPFEDGRCPKGHTAGAGTLTLRCSPTTRIRWSVVEVTDVSHALAKRYSAVVRVNAYYEKAALRAIVRDATAHVRGRTSYRSAQTERRWGETPAHVVWLLLCADPEDQIHANWICRTCWVDPTLPAEARPVRLEADEDSDGTSIAWNRDYEARKDFVEDRRGTKEEILRAADSLLQRALPLASTFEDLFGRLERGAACEDEMIAFVRERGPVVSEIVREWMGLPFAPEEVSDYDRACEGLFCGLDLLFQFHTERGLAAWADPENRRWCVRRALKSFHEDLARVKSERQRIP